MRATQVVFGLIALLTALLAVSASALGTPLPQRDTPQRLASGAPAPHDATTSRVAANTIRPGASGQPVRTLQQRLKSRGVAVVVDGSYGPATTRAVRALQRRMGMKPTGIATKAFLRKLGITSFPSGARSGSSRSRYLVTFPMPPRVNYSYTNDFGAPRHQGAHQGTDIIAPKGAPIVSVSYGTVERAQRVERGLGGRHLWIRDPRGNLFYYAHLDTVATGVDVGTEVWPGRQIGTNGNTGDARFGVEHLHFEIRPGGWSSVTNPFPHLTAVDPKR